MLHRYDMSKVAPHRQAEVLRRIHVVESYLAKDIPLRTAVEQLEMSEPSFWRLLRAWRQGERPELIGGSGRERRPNYKVTEAQRRIVEEAESELPDSSMTKVLSRASELGAKRGIKMPGRTNMMNYARQCRRARGLRPEGVTDLLLEFSAVSLPVIHPRFGLVAPVLCVLLEIASSPVILGMNLSFDAGNPSDAARTILHAIARGEMPRSSPPRHFQLPSSSDSAWSEIAAAVSDAGLAARPSPIRPRASAREITRSLGMRPAGIQLLPDKTTRPPDERLVELRHGGDPISLGDARDMLAARLHAAFPGRRTMLVNDPDVRGRLSSAMQDLLDGHT